LAPIAPYVMIMRSQRPIPRSVFGGYFVGSIDDEGFDGGFLGFEAEAELIGESGAEGIAGIGARHGSFYFIRGRSLGEIKEVGAECERSGEAGAIDHGAAHRGQDVKPVGEAFHRVVMEGDAAAAIGSDGVGSKYQATRE